MITKADSATAIIGRVLIGTIGYHNLRNHSLGPILLPRLQQHDWPAGVKVEEMNWGPIAIVQQFEALEEPYDRVVLLTATERGRPVGSIDVLHWQGGVPSPEAVQGRIAEAVTGVIGVGNLLVIGEYFNIWPSQTLVVDVEPGEQHAGEQLTATMSAAVPAVLRTLRHVATAAWEQLSGLQPLRGEQFEL